MDSLEGVHSETFNHDVSLESKKSSGVKSPADCKNVDNAMNWKESAPSPLASEAINCETQKLYFGEETHLLDVDFDFLPNTEVNTEEVEDDGGLESESDEGSMCTVVISEDNREGDDHLTDVESARDLNVFPSNRQWISVAANKLTSPQPVPIKAIDPTVPHVFKNDDPIIQPHDVVCELNNEPVKTSKFYDVSFANGNELVSSCNKSFGLSYANSQEPGDGTQASALDFVQKLIDESDILSLTNASNTGNICSGEIRVNSAVKGPQILAKMAKFSQEGNGGVYNWDDMFEDEGGGEIFTRKKDEFFGLTDKISKKQNKRKPYDGRINLGEVAEESGRSSQADVGVDSQLAMEALESLTKGDLILQETSAIVSSRTSRTSKSNGSKKATEMSLRSSRKRTSRQKSSTLTTLKDTELKPEKAIVYSTDESSRKKHNEKTLMRSEGKGVITISKRAKHNVNQDARKIEIDPMKINNAMEGTLFCKHDSFKEIGISHSSFSSPILSGGDTTVSPAPKRTRSSKSVLSVMSNTPDIATIENIITPSNDGGSSVIPMSTRMGKGPQLTIKREDSLKQHSTDTILSPVAKRTRRSISVRPNTPIIATIENTVGPSNDYGSSVIPMSTPMERGPQRTKKRKSLLKQQSFYTIQSPVAKRTRRSISGMSSSADTASIDSTVRPSNGCGSSVIPMPSPIKKGPKPTKNSKDSSKQRSSDTILSPVAKRTRRSNSGLSTTPEIASIENISSSNVCDSSVIPIPSPVRKGPLQTKKRKNTLKQNSADTFISPVAKQTRRSICVISNTTEIVSEENTINPSDCGNPSGVPTSVTNRKASQRSKKGNNSSKRRPAEFSTGDASEKVSTSSGKKLFSSTNNKPHMNGSISKGNEIHKPTNFSPENHTSQSPYRNSRRKRELSSVRVFLSHHLDDNIRRQQKKLLNRLKINMASSISDATHLIADKFVRTRNMLEAIASGKQIVTHQWLKYVAQANYYLDEKIYTLRDVKKEQELGFNMSLSLDDSRHHNLLQGKIVFITPKAKPSKVTLSTLVKAAHGKVLKKVDSFSDNLLVLSCEEDYEVCLPFLKRGIAVYSSELLLNGIVSRKLEFERYRLMMDRVNGARSTRSRDRS